MNKILIYACTVGRGGVHRVVHTLCNTLAKVADPAEWQFAVLGQGYDEIGIKVDWPADWPFEQIEPLAAGQKPPAHPKQFEWAYQQQETFVAHLKRKLAAEQYDMVFCMSPWWTFRVQDLSLPVPLVTQVPDFAFDHIDVGSMAYYFRNVAKEIAQRADFTVFASDFQRKWGEQYYNFTKTRTVHYSADFIADNFNPTGEEAARVKAKYGLPDQYVLAFHPMYHKGITTILDAYDLDGEPLPPLVLGGIGTGHLNDDTPADDHIWDIRARIKAHVITKKDRIWALGYVPEPDIAGLYAGAMCALAASSSEGDLSGTIFEAIMAQCPIVYSDIDVFTEQLQRDKYGWCFPVGDGEGLRDTIIRVAEQPGQAALRTQEAAKWAKGRTVKDVACDYLDVFREVLIGKHS